MPRRGFLWYHIVLNTHCSWLHGDERGFRSRNHRIHSSGDYKHPPPKTEHEGLRHYHRGKSREPLRIPQSLHATIGRAIVAKVLKQGYRILVISVDPLHTHLLVELLNNRAMVKKLAGIWKQTSSHAVRHTLPGQIWSQGCDPKPVRTRSHQLDAFQYILDHADEGAWVWSYRELEA